MLHGDRDDPSPNIRSHTTWSSVKYERCLNLPQSISRTAESCVGQKPEKCMHASWHKTGPNVTLLSTPHIIRHKLDLGPLCIVVCHENRPRPPSRRSTHVSKQYLSSKTSIQDWSPSWSHSFSIPWSGIPWFHLLAPYSPFLRAIQVICSPPMSSNQS